jgi:hypothetical protein
MEEVPKKWKAKEKKQPQEVEEEPKKWKAKEK